MIERIAKQVPGIALGADVIVGFPGEGDEEFSNTLDLVQQSPLTHLHVFSYSPRPGTRGRNEGPGAGTVLKRKEANSCDKLG